MRRNGPTDNGVWVQKYIAKDLSARAKKKMGNAKTNLNWQNGLKPL